MIIAIDGPAGAGKSTIAKAVAKKLNFMCLDTGAMYRAIAWKALQDLVDLDDNNALEQLALNEKISFEQDKLTGAAKVFLNGVDISDAIRTTEVDKAVSPVSASAPVRAALVVQQQRIGAVGNYVVEGRDIATVVFPNAEIKLFMTASSKARAHRRLRQNVDRGVGSIDFKEVFEALEKRDAYDSGREASPLKPADDAVILDTSDMYIEEVIDKICDMAKDKMR